MIRTAAFAGQFYPAGKSSLEGEVARYLDTGAQPVTAHGVVSPHAGYVYSGATAGAVFSSVVVPPRCIVLAPNHTGLGATAAIMDEGAWEIPTGMIPVDVRLSRELIGRCENLTVDIHAHQMEHSLEVQLPFMLARQPKLSIVPITLGHMRYNICEAIGTAIARVIRDEGGDILIVASSDMNHYEEESITRHKDMRAIERVLALDPRGLLGVCAEEGITMCGVVPTAVMLIAAKQLGATTAELVSHTTSGDTSGDYQAVVGYAGIVVK